MLSIQRVWKGKGKFAGIDIEAGGNFDKDELLICYDAAVNPLIIENTGKEDLHIIKFFGPDINPDAPLLAKYI